MAKVVFGLRKGLATRTATRSPTRPMRPSVKVTSPQRTMTSELDRRLTVGKDVLHRLSQIAIAARPQQEQPVEPNNDAKAVANAVEAFAERLRTKVHGIAA